MAPYHRLVEDSAIQALSRRAVISVPISLCNCGASIIDGIECIIIFDGQLDVAVATIAMSYAVSQLPPAFDEVVPRPDYSDLSARSWAGVMFSALVNRFLSHGEPLPDFRRLVAPPDRTVELQHALMGAAWWLVLHELGHLELGHLHRPDGQALRLANLGRLVVPEAMSATQLQEIDADSYAYNSLNETGKPFF